MAGVPYVLSLGEGHPTPRGAVRERSILPGTGVVLKVVPTGLLADSVLRELAATIATTEDQSFLRGRLARIPQA